MAARGLCTALVCPAFPAQRRIVVDRVLRVDGVPVSASAVAHDPEFPVAPARTGPGSSDVIELLRPQFRDPLGWIPLERVRGAAGSLRDHLALGSRVVLADMDRGGSRSLAHRGLWNSPFSWARRLARGRRRWACGPCFRQRWLIVAGSRHPATRRQVAAARAAGLLVVTTPDADRGDRPTAARHLAAEARRLLDSGAADLVLVTGGETAAALSGPSAPRRSTWWGAAWSGSGLPALPAPALRW
jgi:uncharacterized protein YgbK (DUF1537 family)